VRDLNFYRLLVVPDDLLEVSLRASYLDRQGVSTRAALNMQEALSIAMVWKPQLIVFGDFHDGTSGIEFAEAIRRLDVAEPIRLIMLTTRIDDPLDVGVGPQVDAHLVAPVDMGQLLNTVAGLIELRQRRSPRVPVEIRVRIDGVCEDEEAQPSTIANGLDLSEVGMRVEPKHPLRVGSEGLISFALPDQSQFMMLKCCVRLVVDELQYHYGLEFLDVGQEDLESLRDFIASEIGGSQ